MSIPGATSTPTILPSSTTLSTTNTSTNNSSSGSLGSGYSSLSGYSSVPDVNATDTNGQDLSTVNIFFYAPLMDKWISKIYGDMREQIKEDEQDDEDG